MNVQHMELLRELADRGSVTAVAAATHRTPSAVSQQLRTAQRHLGTTLVEPSGRGLRLTEAGRVLAEGGRDIARAIAEAEARWDAFRGQPAGRVTVAALPSAAAVLLPPVLAELERTAVELACTDVDVAEAGYAGLTVDYDIAIGHTMTRHRPEGTDDLVTAWLLREPLDIAMRAGHPLARRSEVTPDNLVGVEWYGVPVGFPFDALRLAVEEATGQPVTVVQRLRDNRLIEALVAASDRIAVLPRFTTPVGAAITLRPVAGIDAARQVVAISRPHRAQRLAVRRVLEALRHAGQAVGR